MRWLVGNRWMLTGGSLIAMRAASNPIPALFSTGERGVYYDPSDLTTLFQDAAGTIPVTAPGQPVGLVLDKSRGLVMGPELVVNGGFDADIEGWSPTATQPTAEWANGAMRINYPNVATGYSQTFATKVGARYMAEADVLTSNFYTANLKLRVGDGGIPDAGLADSPAATGPGKLRVSFVATSTTSYVYLRSQNTVTVWDNVSVREIPGTHASQPTAAARPTLGRHPKGGRRNLLLQTENFADVAWSKTGVTVESTATPAPDGSLTASRLNFAASATTHRIEQNGTPPNTRTFSGWVRSVSGNVPLNFGRANAAGTPIIATPTWQRFTWTSATAYPGVNYPNGDGASILVWGFQWEDGTAATPYQKVTDQFDVTEAGVPDAWYLHFNGVNQFLSTPAIDFTNSDEMMVVVGVRKLSDGQYPTIAQLSPVWVNTTGTITFSGNTGNGYAYGSRGTATNVSSVSGFLAPDSAVLSGVSEITPSKTVLRANGVQVAESLGNQGSGNYGNNPLFIGMRGGVDQPLHGHLYGLVVRGKLPTAAELAATETALSNAMRIAA